MKIEIVVYVEDALSIHPVRVISILKDIGNEIADADILDQERSGAVEYEDKIIGGWKIVDSKTQVVK